MRIPTRFQRRRGRKRIVAPVGSAIVPRSEPQPDRTLVKAVARAWRWRSDEGIPTVDDIGAEYPESYVRRSPSSAAPDYRRVPFCLPGGMELNDVGDRAPSREMG